MCVETGVCRGKEGCRRKREGVQKQLQRRKWSTSGVLGSHWTDSAGAVEKIWRERGESFVLRGVSEDA